MRHGVGFGIGVWSQFAFLPVHFYSSQTPSCCARFTPTRPSLSQRLPFLKASDHTAALFGWDKCRGFWRGTCQRRVGFWGINWNSLSLLLASAWTLFIPSRLSLIGWAGRQKQPLIANLFTSPGWRGGSRLWCLDLLWGIWSRKPSGGWSCDPDLNREIKRLLFQQALGREFLRPEIFIMFFFFSALGFPSSLINTIL